jgi:murein DD-endopeptidase MepM/ murein hydrolase activator NlpD/capsular polysaccharide biosynthesis protein
MDYHVDGWIEGPGLVQSAWRYKWLIAVLVLLGILGGSLFSATQPTRYEGVVRIFVTAEGPAVNYPERTVMSHAQFIESPTVSDRVIALTGNRLTRKELERRLTVEPSADADFITIRALDPTPRNAAELADAVDLAYRQIVSEQRKAGAKGTIAALEGVQASLESELAQIKKQRRTGDNPALQAEEQAKKRQLGATANKIEKISADMAGTGVPPAALQDKAAVPDEPAQPKPLRAAAIGAVVGLVIGAALAWWLAARRRLRPGEDTAEFQAKVDDDLEEAIGVLDEPVEQLRTDEPPVHAASAVGATASDIRESAEQVRRLADVDDDRVTESVGEAVNSLDKDHDLLYSLAEWLESQHQNFPQITAERLRDRLFFDRVAVLLKTDDGLDLAGCVGWHPDGVRLWSGHYGPSILNKLGGNGERQIGSAKPDEFLSAGLLGNEDQTVVVAPLEHENVAFGVLLVGQEERDSEAPPNGNGNFDGIRSFARSVAPDLHAWVLLHRVREQLESRETQEQTTSAITTPVTAVPLLPTPAGWPIAGAPVVQRSFDPPNIVWASGHRGVDIAAEPGDPILAAAEGTVAFAGSIAGKPVVTIDHGSVRTTYEPVASTLRIGEAVALGQVIGELGTGGHCGNHSLHWGLREGRSYLDPLLLLGSRADSEAPSPQESERASSVDQDEHQVGPSIAENAPPRTL